MRDTSSNKGYDFDYNLILPNKPQLKAAKVNEYFRLAFNYAVKGTAYKCPDDSTTVLTIKVVSKKQSKIDHSCDFAIIYYPYEDADDGYFYLKTGKTEDTHLSFANFRKAQTASSMNSNSILTGGTESRLNTKN